MKIKPPFKKLEHEWLRSSYFGEKIKVNKDDEVYTIDGVVCEFEPEYADAQRHVKQTLHKNITNHIRDKVLKTLIIVRNIRYRQLQQNKSRNKKRFQ